MATERVECRRSVGLSRRRTRSLTRTRRHRWQRNELNVSDPRFAAPRHLGLSRRRAHSLHSLTHSLHSLTRSLAHSLTHALTHELTNSLTNSRTHSLAHAAKRVECRRSALCSHLPTHSLTATRLDSGLVNSPCAFHYVCDYNQRHGFAKRRVK